MSPALRRYLLIAGTALIILGACGFASVEFRPLAVHDFLVKARVAFAGVGAGYAGGLDYRIRDNCPKDGPCRCIALIHGLGDSWLTWERILREKDKLPPGMFYAMDLPGTGVSAPPSDPAGYGVREQAKNLRRSLETICPRWTLAGNSLGGWIAAWAALDWPEGVEKLVLVNAAGLEDPSGTSRRAAEELYESSPSVLKEFFAKARHKAPVLPDRVFVEMSARLRERPVKATLGALDEKRDYLNGRLAELRMPVEILWGESDRIIPPAQARDFHKRIPGSRLTLIPECGHLPQKECPGPVFAALSAEKWAN